MTGESRLDMLSLVGERNRRICRSRRRETSIRSCKVFSAGSKNSKRDCPTPRDGTCAIMIRVGSGGFGYDDGSIDHRCGLGEAGLSASRRDSGGRSRVSQEVVVQAVHRLTGGRCRRGQNPTVTRPQEAGLTFLAFKLQNTMKSYLRMLHKAGAICFSVKVPLAYTATCSEIYLMKSNIRPARVGFCPFRHRTPYTCCTIHAWAW